MKKKYFFYGQGNYDTSGNWDTGLTCEVSGGGNPTSENKGIGEVKRENQNGFRFREGYVVADSLEEAQALVQEWADKKFKTNRPV